MKPAVAYVAAGGIALKSRPARRNTATTTLPARRRTDDAALKTNQIQPAAMQAMPTLIARPEGTPRPSAANSGRRHSGHFGMSSSVQGQRIPATRRPSNHELMRIVFRS